MATNNTVGHTALPSTSVFIDYESWFWGLRNLYSEYPNIDELITDIKKRATLEDISFFGDFTKDQIQKELPKLRSISQNIIDCSNYDTKKDYTDFIMLDHIYQTILKRPQIEQYILVTGDGHFHSVAAYLKTFKDKTVGVYAVTGTMSKQLKTSASWCQEIKPSIDPYFTKVLENLQHAESVGIIPSFAKTAETTAQYYNIDLERAKETLIGLMKNGYIIQVQKFLPNGRETRALEVKWDLLTQKGLWAPAQA